MDDSRDPLESSPPAPQVATDGATAPESRALLEQLLDADADLERAFERLLARASTHSASSVQAIVPGAVLDSEVGTLAGLLESIVAEYEDIDRLLGSLREIDPTDEDAPTPEPSADAVAPVVSEEALVDPSEQVRLEALFEKARRGLDRLDAYQLCRRPAEAVLEVVEQESNLRTVQGLVEFLRALNQAADTFESLDLPRPHIRDYLRHLYTMRDWEEMGRLVRMIESTVQDFSWGSADPAYEQVVVTQATDEPVLPAVDVEPRLEGSGEHEAQSLGELVDQLEDELADPAL